MKTHAALLALASALLVLPGCSMGPSIAGSGIVVQVDPGLGEPSFTEVRAGHAFEVEVIPGDVAGVVVHADDNLLEHLIVDVRGDTLVIGMRSGNYRDTHLTAQVTMAAPEALHFSGATRGTAVGFTASRVDVDLSGASQLTIGLDADEVHIDLSGASKLEGTVQAQVVRIESSGASKLSLDGSADHLDAEASGASGLRLAGFDVQHLSVDTSGASHATVRANETINAWCSGASSVTYEGAAQLIRAHSSAASSIRHR